jgi:hypothetical protein
MNPRLVEPGFVVVCLHVDGPARPGKDEGGDGDEAQRQRRHEEKTRYPRAGAARKRFASMLSSCS